MTEKLSFTDKQKLREFSTTEAALQQILKEFLKAEKKRQELESRKVSKGKLTSESKHRIKVGNHPHKNMPSKPAILRRRKYKWRILEMYLKLKE